MRRVVVTGMGAVTPVGNNVSDMWNAIQNGVCGIDKITHYDIEGRKVSLAGEVKNFDPEAAVGRGNVRKMDMFTIFAMSAAKEAMEDSSIDMEKEDTLRCGVIFSSGIGGLDTLQKDCERGNAKGFDRVSPHFVPMTISNMAAGNIAIAYGFHGMCTCVVTACASATNAIGDAFRQIRDGYLDVCLCGGSEASATTFGIGGFTSMHALSTATDPKRASIPFDKERNGFVMGEGAGALILEEYEHAVARGAKIYCEVAGYGATCDANHVTAPLEDGSMAAKSMQMAMEDAKIDAGKIDYINAHGTSTELNDKGETNAIKLAFGDKAKKVCVSSSKSMTGHLLGASGAVEAIITALSVRDDVIPPNINYQVPDEACDLNIVANESRKQTVDYALSDSLGFGGHNASIILKKVGK
ncbi:MAG: beta-ketoacyl-ACP synthase II [Lachnospiraceae bacterium]|nr:beta-ketoacyl-ACP synthase II [Lachnospiraceae bacterium]